MITHEFLPRVELERKYDNTGRRYYVSPTGFWMPSVTTVLKEFYNKDFSGWEKRIGKENAEKQRKQALWRGTKVHEMCEKFILNEDYAKGMMPNVLADFERLKPILQENVTEVYGLEFMTYSESMDMAGTTDLICKWKNTTSIVDYKTSKKEKKEAWIEDYFVQAAIYATMISENFGIDVPQIVIILLVEHECPQIFEKKVSTYKEKINEVVAFNKGTFTIRSITG